MNKNSHRGVTICCHPLPSHVVIFIFISKKLQSNTLKRFYPQSCRSVGRHTQVSHTCYVGHNILLIVIPGKHQKSHYFFHNIWRIVCIFYSESARTNLSSSNSNITSSENTIKAMCVLSSPISNLLTICNRRN